MSEIGDILDVSYLVEGSVRKIGDTLRIFAQLIRAADDNGKTSAVPAVLACYFGGTETTNLLPTSCPSTTSRSRAMSAS